MFRGGVVARHICDDGNHDVIIEDTYSYTKAVCCCLVSVSQVNPHTATQNYVVRKKKKKRRDDVVRQCGGVASNLCFRLQKRVDPLDVVNVLEGSRLLRLGLCLVGLGSTQYFEEIPV